MSLLTQLPEDFLHYIWNTCNFDLHDLRTLGGERVYIRETGKWNHDQGPDFFNARLQIDGMEWHGQVELHVHAEDWYKHKHHFDKAYNNTILHVVLHSNGKPIFREDGSPVPELVLGERIDPDLLKRYHKLLLSEESIPCEKHLAQLSTPLIQSALELASSERLSQKAARFRASLEVHIQDWEQVLWEELLSMMGGTVNREVFRDLAQRLPLRLLRKEQASQLAQEALLFGTAGMIPSKGEHPYIHHLQREWVFLRQKYQLPESVPLNIRFMRMRPSAFPTIRLSQAANLLQCYPILNHILHLEGLTQFLHRDIQASEYWNEHHRFAAAGRKRVKKIGWSQKAILLSNCLLPMSLLYLEAHGDAQAREKLIPFYAKLPAEKNRISRIYENLSWPNRHAGDSQGMIHLYKNFCSSKACLHCEIGKEILA
ncbi:MAG: DUF2851 family protein [Bacteroidota bacterium]